MPLEKILIIDEDKNTCTTLKSALEKENCNVILSNDGAEAMIKFSALKPDFVLLDITISNTDGWQICREIRRKSNVPLIIITSNSETFDKVLGLELGADDYMEKPFDTKELVARVKAVLRRAGTQDKKGDASRIVYDGLIIDMEQYQVTAFGHKMTFTTKEMELLWCLASNPGKAFSRNQLLETIWGYSYYGDTRTVDTHIKRIRQKLNIPADAKWDITTIWGVGYKFEVKDK